MEKSPTERIKLTKTLQDKVDKSSWMLSYLDDHYPIPKLDLANCINVAGVANAYMLDCIDANRPASVNLMISPSCTGQDSVIEYLDVLRYPTKKVITATTRDRRSEENETAYVWMDRPSCLSEDETVDYLVDHYNLAECQRFGEDYYGTPLESLKGVANNFSKEPAIVKNDQYGVRAIRKKIGDDVSINTIAMIPESYQQLWDRLVSLRRNNPVGRIAEAAIFMTQFEEVSDYALLNRHHRSSDIGIRRTALGLVDILQHHTTRGDSHE